MDEQWLQLQIFLMDEKPHQINVRTPRHRKKEVQTSCLVADFLMQNVVFLSSNVPDTMMLSIEKKRKNAC
jgi:hypothetical protein